MSKNKNKSLSLFESLKDYDIPSIEKSISDYQVPDYIYSNMKHRFRYYQEEAFRYYHYSQCAKEFKQVQKKHVLFNMATGSGKTDLMAGLILYLYEEHGYQNFIFTVNTNSVLNKTIDNLTNSSSEKYLYNNPIEINNERIHIEKVNQFPMIPNKGNIYIKLDTIQGISSDLFTQKENTMGIVEYERNKTVILADEAHHYSASTTTEKESEKSWEKTIDMILDSRKDNLLLEFTATIDLSNDNIYEKYRDKVIYRYTLDRYILDRYSKNIRRIQSSNTDIDNMMNVILLSEYRRRYASEEYGITIKPVILFKSPRIADSNEAEEKFNNITSNLTVEKVLKFIQLHQKIDTNDKESETLILAYNYYIENEEKLPQIIQEMKRQFSPSRIINANDSGQSNMLEKGYYDVLNTLESPSNLYRVIFAVAKLTEGWDVLNLYDIVRISDSPKATGTKTNTISEAQLIGRGARYNPFIYQDEISYKRRFEDGDEDSLLLETLHYHTINEPQYLKNLVASLNEMDLPTQEDTKNPLLDIKVKGSFKKTQLYKTGKIYYNEKEEKEDSYYNSLTKYGVDNKDDAIIQWKLKTQEVSYSSLTSGQYDNTFQIPVKVDKRYFIKAMNRNSFYHFNNLKKVLPLLRTREEFLDSNWLNIDGRTLYALVPTGFDEKDFTPNDKLEILEIYLKDIEKKIKSGYQKSVGTNKFIGYPIKDYISNYKKRVPNYDTNNNSNIPQKVSEKKYEEDFFVYDSAIINETEKQFVNRIKERLEELKEEYEDVYLVRMDENMHRESVKSESLKLYQFDRKAKQVHLEAFQPDFLLLLQNKDYHLQIFIEPKGLNRLEQDQWKEDILMYINDNESEIIFEDDIDGIKIKGLKFYTINDGRQTMQQLGEIALGHNFKSLSNQQN